MGKVYRARDTRLNRTVALKVLLGDHRADPSLRRRFLQEAQAASGLNHPNIITIFDIVSEADSDILVMEFLAGRTLAESIPPGGLRAPAVISYGAQIADALASAHAAGIVHRDLKPGNVMITGRDRVKVLDFGLAKLSRQAAPEADPDATRTAPLTMQGMIMGTVSYMSPEQAQGQAVDTRSDIFALGAVLYEMATGKRAFQGANTVSTLTAVLRDEPESLVATAPDIPPALDAVIHRCLRKSPADRYQTMDEVRDALNAIRGLTASIPVSSVAVAAAAAQVPPPQAQAQAKSKTPLIAGIAVALAAAVGGIFVITRPKADLPAVTREQVPAPAAPAAPPKPAPDQSPAAQAPAVRAPAETPRQAAKKAAVPDGTPVRLRLLEEVPSKVEPGTRLKFSTVTAVKSGDVVVIVPGAPAEGVVLDRTKKKFIAFGSKALFEMQHVMGAGGQRIKIRAVPSANNGDVSRPVEVSGPKPKNVLAPVGAEFTGYVDGEQQITLSR